MVATRALPQNQLAEDSEAELRRCLRDVVALSGLPGIWINADAGQVATSLAQLIVSVLDADIASVSVPDPPLNIVQCHNRTGTIEFPFNELQPEWCKANVRFQVDHPREGRLYGCSVAVGKEPGSILVALSRRNKFPTDTEQLLIRVAANQAAVAIQRWKTEQSLRSEISRRKEIDSERLAAEKALSEHARTLEILNRTGKKIAAELDLKAVVQLVTDAGVELTGAEFGAFFYNLIDQSGEQYMLYSLSGAERSAFEKFPMPRNTAVFAPTFRGETIVRSDDITRDPRYGKNKPNCGMPKGHLPVRSYLAVPVKSRSGEVLGGLFFGHSKPGVFSENNERTVVGIAAQAAIAMDNARLFEAAQQEIEDRKRIEEALRLRGEEFSALAENIPTLCWMAHPNGHIFWYNHRWYEYTGMAPETQQGWGWECVHDPKVLPSVLERWRHSISTGQDFEMVFPLRGADGVFRPFLTRVVPIRNEHGEILRWFGTNVDITEQRAAEAELERRVEQAVEERNRAEAAFRQSQKMEAIGQLTGGVAHDFNNLLTVIRSSVDLLRKPDLPDEKRRRYIDAISQTTDRAANLTSQLLAFARRQPLQAAVFDVTDKVSRTIDFLRPIVGSRIEILTDGLDSPRYIKADPNQLETALINIAANARDAMAGEGKLVICIDELSSAQTSLQGLGQFVSISISDTGAGISPDHLEHLFEPFFTTKEVGKGTGLGLSQVYGFVKQSGGDVRVTSELGRGTEIMIYLPKVDEKSPPKMDEVSEPRGEDAQAAPRSILVVEDNQEVGSFAVQLLNDLGFTTTLVENAKDALSIIEGEPRKYDIVFSDIVMPGGMSGVDLAAELKKRWPALPVILTSGYSEIFADGRGRDFELLRKPYSVEALSRLIRKTLCG